MLQSLNPKTPGRSTPRITERDSFARDKGARQRTCRVPVCPDPHCQLWSHRNFGRSARTRDETDVERPIYNEAQVLGLETAEERGLFQHCLDGMTKRKLFTYSAAHPAVQSLSAMRDSIVTSAIESKGAAMIVVSIAFCDVFLHRSMPTRDLDRYYMKVDAIIRNESNPDVILMGLVVHSILDHYRGRDLRPHRKMIKDIAYGRVHTLRESLHYVIEADRRLALWTSAPSDLATNRPEIGEAEYVRATRELIGLFEKEGRCLHSRDITPMSPFIQYKRGQLADAFTFLQAATTGKGWCTIAAARIMEYRITFEGELESCMIMIVGTLGQRLKSKIQEVDWSGDKQMLIWILFVVEDIWTIRRLLEDLHGGKLPTCGQQWSIVREHFVWAERNKPQFERLFEAVTKCIIRSDSAD